MLIKAVDFPEDLLRAQATGNLVVFAGAGVSHPPPSSLPLFSGLAGQIGNVAARQKEEHEPEDRYLGRLKIAGVRVHEAAARLLVNEQTRATELHRYLLQLFPSGDKVRLVTTNFDIHFSTTAAELYQDKIEIFYAPALPLGNEFSGLVYLHGSAGKDPKRCVLTDEDFGRAYLTEAWASRFLAAMFAQYIVLFVGYSHNDIVMNYLARGLPPTTSKRRFAFTTGDRVSLAKWEFLGISPLVYEKSSGENPHSAITVSVGEWVGELSRGLLEKAQRIRSIAESQPPLEGEDSDYIKYAIGDESTRHLFFKYARQPQWIAWLETRGFTKRLFDPHAVADDFHRQLAAWLADHFVAEHSSELMAAVQRNGSQIHRQLAWYIWRRLCIRDKRPVGDGFSRWTALLLAQPRSILQYDEWCSLLRCCRFPEDKPTSLLLFSLVTTPNILLQERWDLVGDGDPGEKVSFDLDLFAQRDHWLDEAWEQIFKPNLAIYAHDLLPIVTSNLAAGHILLQACGRGRRDYDPFRLSRQSIAHSEGGGFEKILDVLIDAAAAITRYIVESKPHGSRFLIDAWIASDLPILRRLAIYASSHRIDITADDKLQWLMEEGLLYEFKTDTFELLQICYPKASKGMKERLITQVFGGPTGGLFDQLDPRTKAYETYNYLVWLTKISPDCGLTRNALNQLQQQYPDFGPREFPERDFWSTDFETEPSSLFNIELIGSRSAAEFLDQLLAWKPKHPMDKSRADFCSAVSAVVSKKPEWGFDWIRTLQSRQLLDVDLWECVSQGWRDAALTPEQWHSVFDVAASIEAPASFLEAFTEVLKHGSRKEQNSIPDQEMSRAQSIAERIWDLALKTGPPATAGREDWLTTAINQPGGKIAQFWLQRLSVARRIGGDSWQGLSSDITTALVAILHSPAGAAAHARIVFASQLHYFFHLDATFAQRELLPLFDWNTEPLRAEQCWHGYLWWGRWLSTFTAQLLPYFDEALIRLQTFPAELQKHAVRHVVGLALFRLDDPVSSGGLSKTLMKLSEDNLVYFASEIDRFLRDTDTSLAEKIWDRWLKRFWEMRLLGTPKPLSAKEATEMVYWSTSLGQRFPEAVKLVAGMNHLVAFDHTDLLYRIEQKGLVKSQPEAAADLILFWLKCKPHYFHMSEHTRKVWTELKAADIAPKTLTNIREAMLALGYDPE